MDDFNKIMSEKIRKQLEPLINVAPSTPNEVARKILCETYHYDIDDNGIMRHNSRIIGEFEGAYIKAGKLFIKVKMHALLMVNTQMEDSDEH